MTIGEIAVEYLCGEPCNDVISRRAVLKLFATHDGKYLFEAIRDLPSVTPKQRWIPVSERLPETHVFYNTHGKHISSDYVLVTVRLSQNGFHEQMVTVGRYSNNDWKLLYGNICGSIKAWMPLPEPYKAESEEQA